MDTTLTSVLRKVPLFSGLDEASLLALAQRSRRFPVGETLFHEGDPGYTLYIIISGRVKVQTIGGAGEIVQIAQCGVGEHFGELSLFDGKSRMADVVTTEPCDLLMLDHADFVRCVEQSSKFAIAIMANLADRIRQAADSLESHRELDVTGRIAEALLDLLAVYGEDDPAGGRRITHKITQQQLAEQIGATRESVSRALTGLRDVQALRIDGRTLVVLSEKRLRRACSR